MILRIVANAVAVVLLAAVIGALVAPAIARAAVDHVTSGLSELVEIGERLGQSETGRQIARQFSELVGRVAQ